MKFTLPSTLLSFLAALGIQVIVAQDWYLDAVGGGCIGLRNGSTRHGNKLKLLDCEYDKGKDRSPSLIWQLDSKGRFHSKLDEDVCMQAGRGKKVSDGTKMRVYPCSDSVYQQFEFEGDYGPIKPKADRDLCVVRHGVTADIGRDNIILKNCEGLDDDRAEGWEADRP